MTTLSSMKAIRDYWMPRDESAQVLVRITDIDWMLHEIERLTDANIKLIGALDQIHGVLNGEGDPQDLHLVVNAAIVKAEERA